MHLAKFKRSISLYKLGIHELSDREKLIYDCLIDNFSNLSRQELSHSTVFICKSNQQAIFEYIDSNQTLWVAWDFLKLIEDIFDMDYGRVDDLIIWWMEHTFSLNPRWIYRCDVLGLDS